MSENNITPAEWEVMRIVWVQGETTSREVYSILNEKKEWKSTTVKTLLKRLVEKGMLSTRTQNNKYIYTALVEQRKSVQNITNELLSKICSTKVGTLIETLIMDSQLSYNDIDGIEQAVQEKKKTAVEKVICNCTPGQCQCHQ